MRTCLTLALLVALAAALAAACPAAPYYHAEFIFTPERFHNHASCIVQLPDGNLLACWYRGVGPEKGDDVRIYGARLLKGAKHWTPRFVMADTPGYPDDNPCMFIDARKRLWLIWPNLLANQWHTALTKYRVSTNYQQRQGPPVWAWQDLIYVTPANFPEQFEAALQRDLAEHSQALAYPGLEDEIKEARARAADRLYQRIGWMPRAHPTVLRSGRILVPLYTDGFSCSLVAYSDDVGATWQTSGLLAGDFGIQPSIVERKDGTLLAMMRTAGPHKRILVSESKDQGATWSLAVPSDLPNPGSGLEVIRLANGHWALVYNDSEDTRSTLAVSISDDEGKTWKWTRHLERGHDGSYPSIIQSRDGLLHVTYSHDPPGGGQTIKYAVFNEEWVQQGDPAQ